MDNHFDNQNQDNNYGYQQNMNQNPYEQNPYGQNYNQFDYNQTDPELEKRAGTVKTLGIVSTVLGAISLCCCPIAAPIVGAIGLVKANNLQSSFGMLSPQGQKNVNTGKICAIIGIVLGILGFIANLILQYSGFYESLVESMASV